MIDSEAFKDFLRDNVSNPVWQSVAALAYWGIFLNYPKFFDNWPISAGWLSLIAAALSVTAVSSIIGRTAGFCSAWWTEKTARRDDEREGVRRSTEIKRKVAVLEEDYSDAVEILCELYVRNGMSGSFEIPNGQLSGVELLSLREAESAGYLSIRQTAKALHFRVASYSHDYVLGQMRLLADDIFATSMREDFEACAGELLKVFEDWLKNHGRRNGVELKRFDLSLEQLRALNALEDADHVTCQADVPQVGWITVQLQGPAFELVRDRLDATIEL